MTGITRSHVGTRMSQAVIHGQTVYLSGQCGAPFEPVEVQTRQALDKIDALLADAGTDNTHLLAVTIWLASIADYDAINAIWDNWIPPGASPARSCGETRIGGEGYGIEIICTAALP